MQRNNFIYHILTHMCIQGYEESDLKKNLLYGQADYSGIKKSFFFFPIVTDGKKKKRTREFCTFHKESL